MISGAPPALQAEIDDTLDTLYDSVNNGVYRCGFAGSQEAYETACRDLFSALDDWDQVLADRRYLVGDQITEADIALYVTLVRFDLVYYSHFKCNVRRIQDYPHLWAYTRDLYQTPGIANVCDIAGMKRGVFSKAGPVGSNGIVPIGPAIDYSRPHDRDRLATA